jgi:hypothetical protein
MGKLVWTFGLAVPMLVLLSGCAAPAELGEREEATLRESLESPVDVERIRAEYFREKGKEPPGPKAAPPEEM